MLESVKPDNLIGIETWLDPQIKDAKIFSSGDKLHRKDRMTSSGCGVLIVMKNEYNSEIIPELDTRCEIVLAVTPCRQCNGQNDFASCVELRYTCVHIKVIPVFILKTPCSMMTASSIKNASLVIGGDFSFPGWDWKAKSIKTGTAYTDLSRLKGNDQEAIQSISTSFFRHHAGKEPKNQDSIKANSTSGKPRGQLLPSSYPPGYPKQNQQIVKD